MDTGAEGRAAVPSGASTGAHEAVELRDSARDFPWAASGRSLSLGREEGITKLLFDEATNRVLGCGIAEAAPAIEVGAEAEDIELTVHPHATLLETVAMAAEKFEGSITDLIPPKRPGHEAIRNCPG